MEALAYVVISFELFLLTPFLPFIVSSMLALAMPGWRSLSIVVGLAAVASAFFVYTWWFDTWALSIFTVREGYKYHLALLPVVFGLVGGAALRAYQLKNKLPRLGWYSVGFVLLGLFVHPNPSFSLYQGG